MDIHIPGIRDRRIAASDEYLDGDERLEREQFNAYRREWNPRRPHSGRFIYGQGSGPRLASQRRPLGFDVTDFAFAREPDQITTLVLHSTAGNPFTAADMPDADQDGSASSDHRLDEIIANFVILEDGTIVYTHDIQHILSVAGGRRGIDIEFAGRFPHSPTISEDANRLSHAAIRAGRTLIAYLAKTIPSISHIHPHGQIQRGSRGGRGNGGKYDSCPGPDVWVNLGEWAANLFGLSSASTESYYPNHGISPRQSNPAYRQDI
jgi:hypothetical protein